MPRQSSAGRGHPCTALIPPHYEHSRIHPHRKRKPVACAARQNLLGVPEIAGSTDEPPTRRSDPHVEAAELIVELAGTEVLVGVPPAQIIVHRDLRIPLRNLIQIVAVAPHARTPRSRVDARNCEPPRDLQSCSGAGKNRSPRSDCRDALTERIAPAVVQWNARAVDYKAFDDHSLSRLGN